MRPRLPLWSRIGSDEALALALTAMLCASAPVVVFDVDVPPPAFLPATPRVVLAAAITIGAALRSGLAIRNVLGRLLVAAGAVVFGSVVACLLIARHANGWFAPEPLYEAAALMLGGHLAGLAIARLGPRLPMRLPRFHVRPLDLGASAERLARAMVRAALAWLVAFWATVALGGLYVSVVALLLAAVSVGLSLPLRLVVGAVGIAVPQEREVHRNHGGRRHVARV